MGVPSHFGRGCALLPSFPTVRSVVLERRGEVTARADFPLRFAAEVDCSGTQPVLVLRGELDVWTQQRFAAALASYAEQYAPIVLNLAEVEFLDAGNIGLIHQARARARLRGTDVILQAPSPQLSRILELTGLQTPAPSGERPAPITLPLSSRAYERSPSQA